MFYVPHVFSLSLWIRGPAAGTPLPLTRRRVRSRGRHRLISSGSCRQPATLHCVGRLRHHHPRPPRKLATLPSTAEPASCPARGRHADRPPLPSRARRPAALPSATAPSPALLAGRPTLVCLDGTAAPPAGCRALAYHANWSRRRTPLPRLSQRVRPRGCRRLVGRRSGRGYAAAADEAVGPATRTPHVLSAAGLGGVRRRVRPRGRHRLVGRGSSRGRAAAVDESPGSRGRCHHVSRVSGHGYAPPVDKAAGPAARTPKSRRP